MNTDNELPVQLNTSVFMRQPMRHLSRTRQDVIGADDTEASRPESGNEYSVPLPIRAAKTIIEASSAASALIKCNGEIVYINQVLAKQFPEAKTLVMFAEMFDSQTEFTTLLAKSADGSGALPTALTSNTNGQTLSVSIVPLNCDNGSPASLYLVTVRGRSVAQQKMAALKLQVAKSAIQQRRLLEHNRSLQNTVKTTIPKLRALSFTDSLTQLNNRRFYDTQLEREWMRSQRSQDSLSLVLLDIDHFKLYNDTFGHPMGDACLKKVANALKTFVNRRFDSVCRIGGEEFALVLPMTDACGAIEVVNRALSVIRKLAIPHANENIITVSAGVGSCVPERGESLQAFIKKIDVALYRSKSQGRDRATYVDTPSPASDFIHSLNAGSSPMTIQPAYHSPSVELESV